jgi:hypothetical protein
MTSFIELPRVTFNGGPSASIYVNTADIVALQDEYDGQTRVTVRELGSEGVGVIQTYAPLSALLDTLGMLAEHPGVRSWTSECKAAWQPPVVAFLRERYQRERGA